MGAWNFDAFLLDFRHSGIGLSMTLPYIFFPTPPRQVDLSFLSIPIPLSSPDPAYLLLDFIIHDRHDR